MSVSQELRHPETVDDFEDLCCALYGRLWNDPGCTRVGRSGQAQFGVDILGHDESRALAVQCKHYVKKKFTLATVTADLVEADAAGLAVDHLIFATTAPSKAQLVKDVFDLSSRRLQEGKFSVSVHFWEDLSRQIRLHPDIGRTFIPEFPGSTVLVIKETGDAHLALYQEGRARDSVFQSDALRLLNQIVQQGGLQSDATPPSRGNEDDPRVAATLDLVRNHLRQGKSRDALTLLEQLGSPEHLRDTFSRFRWHTNHASVALIEGRYEEAADEFLDAFSLAPDNDKAHANRAHALLLKKLPKETLAACDEGLRLFPDNGTLWSVQLGARRLVGHPDPEHDLPEHLKNAGDILFARAHLHGMRGEFRTATDFLQQCMAVDGGSFEARRAYLANALSWTAVEPVSALNGQLRDEQREALADSIRRIEPVEQCLSAIQSEYISAEMTNNAAVSLDLLGETERARAIATFALRRHPVSEGLLRIRLTELNEHDNVSGIHALTDTRLNVMPTPVLGLLAEISANRGDVPWNAAVAAAIEAAEPAPEKRRDIEILAIHARWVAGQQTDALDAARAHVRNHPKHTLAHVVLGRMLRRLGRTAETQQEAATCIAALAHDDHPLSAYLVADFLFDLRMFNEASVLYASLVITPGDDELTSRLLVCLVESDQRHRARALFDQLPTSVAALAPFRRIQANLARSMGDWALMRDVLREELEKYPADLGLAIGYVGALYRLDDKAALTDYLTSDPQFKDATPKHEFEFAKYQVHNGLKHLAIPRLYRMYRAHSGSVEAAGFYLSQLLLGQHISELDPPTTAGPGSFVTLVGGGDTRVVAIDIDAVRLDETWPELVSSDSDTAKALHDLKSGDRVTLPSLIGNLVLEVAGIGNLFTFVADKAHNQVAAAADPVGPLRSVRIIKDDGQPNVEMLIESARQRKLHVAAAFAAYKQHRFPVSMLARALGTDPVTLLLEWPFKEATFFVGIGTREERDSATSVLREGARRYVVDLLTIAELVQRNCFDAASRILCRPLVPQTAREHLLLIRQLVDAPRASATMTEHDGRLQLTDTPPGYYEERAAFLTEMLRVIDTGCDVLPTTGPQEVTDHHRFLAEVLDGDSLDALYLCIERNAVLVSDDAALRLLAPDAGVSMSIGVQPVLMEACVAGHLSRDAYADAVHGKIAAGHEFVSIGADELLTLALRVPAQIADGARAALETFRKPNLDLLSGVRVSCEFLVQTIQRLPLTTAAQYAKVVLDVLQHGRDQRSAAIHRVVAHTVQESVKRSHRRLNAHERKALAHVLVAPPRLPIPKGATTIAMAVHEILMACRRSN